MKIVRIVSTHCPITHFFFFSFVLVIVFLNVLYCTFILCVSWKFTCKEGGTHNSANILKIKTKTLKSNWLGGLKTGNFLNNKLQPKSKKVHNHNIIQWLQISYAKKIILKYGNSNEKLVKNFLVGLTIAYDCSRVTELDS